MAEWSNLKQTLRLYDDNHDVEIFQIDETNFIGGDHIERAWSQKGKTPILT